MLKLDRASIKTGVELVDSQHYKYFDILSVLLDKLGTEDHSELFNELVDYVVYHFSTEEELMDKYKYERTRQHKKEHEYFKNKIWEFSRLYGNNNRPVDATAKLEISGLLLDWFVNHIQTVDKRLCKFTLEHTKTNSGMSKMLDSLLNLFKSKYK
jgi:hemerythrin-like metal-binding protein